MNTPRTIEWIGGTDGFVRLIDQTLLPTRLEYRDCRTVEEVWEAIKVLRVRGCRPSAWPPRWDRRGDAELPRPQPRRLSQRLKEVTDFLRTSRPTAVNLFWALDRMERCVAGFTEDRSPEELTRKLLDEALAIEEEDRAMCRAIGAAAQHSSAKARAS